jgi:hypothetical protein
MTGRPRVRGDTFTTAPRTNPRSVPPHPIPRDEEEPLDGPAIAGLLGGRAVSTSRGPTRPPTQNGTRPIAPVPSAVARPEREVCGGWGQGGGGKFSSRRIPRCTPTNTRMGATKPAIGMMVRMAPTFVTVESNLFPIR